VERSSVYRCQYRRLVTDSTSCVYRVPLIPGSGHPDLAATSAPSSRCPPRASSEQTLDASHGQSCSESHFNIFKCLEPSSPFSAFMHLRQITSIPACQIRLQTSRRGCSAQRPEGRAAHTSIRAPHDCRRRRQPSPSTPFDITRRLPSTSEDDAVENYTCQLLSPLSLEGTEDSDSPRRVAT
jgi:hypothetical protein